MNIIYVFIDRIRTESPKFFIVLRWIFGVLALVGWAVKWLIARDIWNPAFEDAIKELCGYAAMGASTVWGTSFLPKKDTVIMDGPGGTDPNKPKPPNP